MPSSQGGCVYQLLLDEGSLRVVRRKLTKLMFQGQAQQVNLLRGLLQTTLSLAVQSRTGRSLQGTAPALYELPNSAQEQSSYHLTDNPTEGSILPELLPSPSLSLLLRNATQRGTLSL